MRDCWNADPDKRPHFDEISEMIGDCLDESVKQVYSNLNFAQIYFQFNLAFTLFFYLLSHQTSYFKRENKI